ncbi:hypothetical protein OOA_06636 [Providencia burhodogranariea DSM 19968]|uniref:Uncharacterized protein n=1 Tax=Providencia burhodogranariea DSM 19968 TaxID=1141662 RepID=K8WPX2_9GAMM|nr:hypothetical protein OOA_06636 [Providencia burhodogranariea DSM 19968]
MYHDGDGVVTDWYGSFSWIQKTAKSRVPHAQSMLGFMYQNGHAVT